MISCKEAAAAIWNMSFYSEDGEPRSERECEAMLLAVWALMEQARFQENEK